VEHAKGAPEGRPVRMGSAEDVLGGMIEPIVNHGHQADQDEDEDNHHCGVCRQLGASRPDDLAKLGDHLAVEECEPPQGALLPAPALAGLLLGLLYLFVLSIRHVDGAHGVRHSSSPDSRVVAVPRPVEPHGGALRYVLHTHPAESGF